MAASRSSRLAHRCAYPLFLCLAASTLLITGNATADEAYVCEGGRVVYVRFGELESMKKSDACIAAHYARLQLRSHDAAVVTTQEAAVSGVATVIAGDGAPPLPHRNSARLAPQPRDAASVEIGPAPGEQAEADTDVEAMVLRPRVEAVVFRHRMRRQAEASDTPQAPIDFRRVPILNARPGEPAVFNHTR